MGCNSLSGDAQQECSAELCCMSGLGCSSLTSAWAKAQASKARWVLVSGLERGRAALWARHHQGT